MIILSGIAATTRGGTGRLLLGMIEETRAKGLDVSFLYVGNRANVARSLVLRNPIALGHHALLHYWRRASRRLLLRRENILDAPRLLVLHPQEIGTRWLDALITRRALRGRVTELFVLDTSFFCIRSYNKLDGENRPCLRCLYEGVGEAKRFGCHPFPIRDKWATTFVGRLRDHARSGRVAFWTQTGGHRELLKLFAGSAAIAHVAGLWTDDFDDNEFRFPAVAPLADVVYHGSWHEAKGANWAVSLATAMPERTFLFPCRKPSTTAALPNVIFRSLSWDSGLAEQVQATPLCLVPSLWTAPIEGALVKSIAHAPATAVVSAPYALGEELPDGLVLRLPADVGEAASVLRRDRSWSVDTDLRASWVRSFKVANSNLLERILGSPFESD